MGVEPDEMSEGGDVGESNQARYRRELPPEDWAYDRLVINRPESRTSIIAMRNVVHTAEESDSLSRTLTSLALARRAMSAEERREELDTLRQIEAQQWASAQVGDEQPTTE